jgi:hypothetical protein
MSKQTKIFGITPQEPTFIIRILIEQEFGSKEIQVKQSLIKVIQRQAISEIIETNHGPEVITQISYLTADGIFNTDELSGVGIATNDDEVTIIEMNFCTTEGSDTANLIIPKKKYRTEEPYKNKYLAKIIDHFAPERYAEEVKIEEIKPFLHSVFSQMSGNNDLPSNAEAI